MATKPTDGHLEWIIDDDTNKYIAPSAGKRLQGWIQQEKPPFQYFNWGWRLIDRWLKWAEAQSDENVAVIAANSAHLGRTDNPHAVTKDQVGLGNASNVPAATFVNAADGGPYISSTGHTVSGQTADIWRSYGPTGSGASVIWSVLDAIPSDVKWLELKILLELTTNTNSSIALELYGRKNGSSVAVGNESLIACTAANGESNSGASKTTIYAKVPVSSRIFDLRWHVNASFGSAITTNIAMFLNGCGY